MCGLLPLITVRYSVQTTRHVCHITVVRLSLTFDKFGISWQELACVTEVNLPLFSVRNTSQFSVVTFVTSVNENPIAPLLCSYKIHTQRQNDSNVK